MKRILIKWNNSIINGRILYQMEEFDNAISRPFCNLVVIQKKGKPINPQNKIVAFYEKLRSSQLSIENPCVIVPIVFVLLNRRVVSQGTV